MSDDEFSYELSRRKALAALGTIGAAGAGAGMGTSAFFSDQETFANNQLTAGELDLHVGWEEHYSDWSDDEDNNLNGDVQMVDRGSTAASDRVGLPLDADSPTNGTLITVNNISEARQFLNNTKTDSYANVTGFDPSTASGDPCDYLADGTDQSPVIIDLNDVKPGDFGEITFSFAVCDNPGYVWLNGGLMSASENGTTEPEAEDEDEMSGTVELLDKVRAGFWYDDGDNLQSGGGEATGSGKADIVFVVDTSGSIEGDERPGIESAITGQNGVAQQIQDQGIDAQYAIVDYNRGAGIDLDLTANVSDVGAAFSDGTAEPFDSDTRSGDFGESLSNAILVAAGQKGSGSDVGVSFRSDAKTIYVGITDEDDQSTSQEKTDAVNLINNNNAAFLGIAENMSQISTLLNGVNQSRFSTFMQGNISQPLQDLAGFAGGVVEGEETFVAPNNPSPAFTGTLREVLNELDSGDGIALDGDRSTAFNEVGGGGDDSKNRDAFEAEVEHNIGFAWWLPVNHANEIQSDTATFRLGFYTEQERHNTGEGEFANS